MDSIWETLLQKGKKSSIYPFRSFWALSDDGKVSATLLGGGQRMKKRGAHTCGAVHEEAKTSVFLAGCFYSGRMGEGSMELFGLKPAIVYVVLLASGGMNRPFFLR